MNNLDHVKNFYPENYKLDLSETMKAALSKGGNIRSAMDMTGNGVGYVTEKLYLYLQLYLQNKGWNPDLQCFADLKDNAMLPSAAYLQVLANRLTLDQQGRLILRENGKIVLPFEHFANAVMLKHMSGPHGIHLSLEATVRAVIESYTIGRENFGMEKEFIIEVVQSCPSPACRQNYLPKNYLGLPSLPFLEQQFPGVNPAEFLQHLPHLPPPPPPPQTAQQHASNTLVNNNASSSVTSSSVNEVELKTAQHAVPQPSPKHQHLSKHQQNSLQSQLQNAAAAAAAAHQQQMEQQQAALAKQQQQLTAALIHQQNRALAQQSLEKFSNLSAMEKQRILQQLDPKHFDPMAVAAAAAANLQMQGLIQSQANASAAAASAISATSNTSANLVGTVSSSNNLGNTMVSNIANNSHAHSQHHLQPPPQSPTTHNVSHLSGPHSSSTSSTPLSSSSSSSHSTEQMVQKNVELLRSNLDTLESNKDLLALHNGSWGSPDVSSRCNATGGGGDTMPVGQDKIVRVFAELIRNMTRMKTYIRPSMCKPYGKQSESLQKTLLDTIQIVQTLRNCLPAPHIPVTSWKSESEGGGNSSVNTGMLSNNGLGGNGPNGAGTLNANRLENISN